MHKFHIHTLSSRKYGHTLVWAIVMSIAVVCGSALLGRAAHNFRAALTDKPDVAIYLLLPNEGLKDTTFLGSNEDDTIRKYLAETVRGPELIILRKNKQWLVDSIEKLHEGVSTETETLETETQSPR